MKVWEALLQKGPSVHTVAAEGPLRAAIHKLVTAKIRALPVVEGDRLVGIVAVRDILARLDEHGGEALDHPVREMMTKDVVSVDRDVALEEVERLFVEHEINHIPVVHDGKLVGVLTPLDVFGTHLDDVQWMNEHLRDYLHGVSFP